MSPSSQKPSEALAAGVSGYVVKHCDFEELREAVGSVLEGRLFISPSIAQELIAACVRGRRPSSGSTETLTARERQVLQLLTEGWTARAIGDKLDVSVKTIESYRRQIMEKLNIDSIALLTKYAVREGLPHPRESPPRVHERQGAAAGGLTRLAPRLVAPLDARSHNRRR